MALRNTTDPARAGRALTAWLGTRMPDAQDIVVGEVALPASSGLSTETLLFDMHWSEDGERHGLRLVARIQPAGPATFPSYDFDKEFRVLRTLHQHTALAVPDALWHETGDDVLGAPFIVMKRIDGRVPADDPPFTREGWVMDLSPAERAELADNALSVVAHVHAVDWRALDLGLAVDGLPDHIAYWRETFAWAAEGEANPIVERAFEWVERHAPTNEESVVLNWGDARIGNLLFADDVSVAGVLDWEMTCLASPEMDLGWWLFLTRNHTDGYGLPLPDGFPNREQTIERYEELTGHLVKHADFYEAFAGLRLAILTHRAGRLMIDAGLLPSDSVMRTDNPASHLLAKLIGMEAAAVGPETFIGKR